MNVYDKIIEELHPQYRFFPYGSRLAYLISTRMPMAHLIYQTFLR